MAKKVSQTAVKDKKVASKKVTKKEESSSSSDSSSDSDDSDSSSSDSDSSSSDSDSDSDSSSSDDSDDEQEEKEEKEEEQKKEEEKEAEVEEVENKEESTSSSSSSSSDSDSGSDSSSSSDSDSSSSSDSDSASSDSDSDSDEKEEEEEGEAKDEEEEESSKKRKSSDSEEEKVEEPETKKPKADASEPATLFVGRLSFNVDDEWLKSEFESIGGVLAARVISDRSTNRSKGYGYVDFESKELAQKALDTMQGKEIDGRPINLDFSNSKPQALNNKNSERSKKFGDVKSEPSDTLFVGNLSFNTTRDSLQEAFAEYGEIISARVPTNPETEQPKGFGYVQFSSIEDATKALNTLNGEYLDGRPVRLDFSTPRPARDNGGRFGGDRGGRGNFGGNRGSFGGNRGSFGGNRGSFGGNRGGRSRESTPKSEFKGTKKTFD